MCCRIVVGIAHDDLGVLSLSHTLHHDVLLLVLHLVDLLLHVLLVTVG